MTPAHKSRNVKLAQYNISHIRIISQFNPHLDKMHRTIQRRLSDSYKKNKDDVRALVCGLYPRFVYKSHDKLPKGEIPVFVFHSVDPQSFEAQLRYLADNGYRTLNAEELLQVLTKEKKPQENTIALTFDDGRGSLWATAYPLLKKYGFCATSFIVPFWIKEETKVFCNLEDVWGGCADLTEIQEREAKVPLCTWAEIREMHKSGVIDFQSHTSYHNSVFINDRLVDFINPSFRTQALVGTLCPVIRKNGHDVVPNCLELGHPIYEWAPSMSTEGRFIEDDALSEACVSFVRENGGSSFFRGIGWRKKLSEEVWKASGRDGRSGGYQSREERVSDIRRDLVLSKETIENKLDTRVHHLCYPWFAGSSLAVEISKEVGYLGNYWGVVGSRAMNTVGTNPYLLARMSEDYVWTLPGEGRKELYCVLMDKIVRTVRKDRHGRSIR